MTDEALRDMTLGQLAELAVQERAEKQALEKAAAVHGSNLERIKEQIYAHLLAEGLDRASVNGLTVSRSDTLQPNVTDWDAVDAYALELGIPDIRQRRISAALWREMVQDGAPIPGIEAFVKNDVNIRKSN